MFAQIAGAAALFSPLVLGQTPADTFYPPNLNDTAYISNTCLGTYGGVYSAPKRSENSSQPYGTYNYCTMPHPRVLEYAVPEAISNGSVNGSLYYLQYLQRHQRRTPYNIFPYGERELFNCDDVKPFLYAAPTYGIEPIPVYAHTYTDPTNPFVETYVAGSCQFPQLTVGGFFDGYQHGKDIWDVYGDKLGLIPQTPDNSTRFRSTESPLTQQSAGTVLRGVWPDYQGALPLFQQTTSVDTVNQGYSCSAIDTVLDAIKETDEWTEHLNVTAELRDTLGTMLGANTSAWQDTFDHFSDNFQGRLCNGYSLPCSLTNVSDCVSDKQADMVFRAGDWEWNYYWHTNPNVTLYIQLVEGLFIGEIVTHLQSALNGTRSAKYDHVFVHDGDIGPILGALGITQLRWPAMASNIAIEVWETTDTSSTYYARVLYSGQPVRTAHGVLDWLPLQSLIDILEPFVPTDIVSLCSSV